MSDIKQLDELKPKIPIKINSLVGAFNYLFSPTYEFNGERHVYWEVVGVFDSCARIISDSTELFLHTNEFYIHRPMEFHAIYPHKQSLHVGIFAFTSNSEDLYSIADKVILAPDLMNLYSSILLEGSQALAGINSVPPLDSTNSPPFAADQTTKILAEFFLINLIRAFFPSAKQTRKSFSIPRSKQPYRNASSIICKCTCTTTSPCQTYRLISGTAKNTSAARSKKKRANQSSTTMPISKSEKQNSCSQAKNIRSTTFTENLIIVRRSISPASSKK